MIAPAPRKPTPLTICAAIRVGSVRTRLPPLTRNSWKPYAETIVKSAAPMETSMCVRNPASRSRNSRSRPIAPPSAAATPSRSRTCDQWSVGIAARSSKRRRRCFELVLADLDDSAGREVDQLVQLLASERIALGRRRGEQRVLGRHPAAAGTVEPARHLLLNGRGAEDDRPSLRPEHRAVRLFEEVRADLDRPQLVGPTSVVARRHAAAFASAARVTCPTSELGNCRKRRPCARNAAGSPVVRNR